MASFVGRPERPGVIFQEHRVRLSISRGPDVLVRGREIHFADWLDDPFEYESHDWVHENVLRVGSYRRNRDDTLTIRNDSSRRIVLIRIWAADMFFAADLEPKAFLQVAAPGPFKSRWIGINGLWEDGDEIKPFGEVFDSIRGRSEFAISVGDGSTSMRRRERP